MRRTPIDALLAGLPPICEHTDSLLARAAADGPMRRRVVQAWAAIQKDPARAGFALRSALRRCRDLKPWERRLVAAGLYSMVRSHRLLAAVMGAHEGDGAALWRGWLVRQGLPVEIAPEAAACADLEAAAEAFASSSGFSVEAARRWGPAEDDTDGFFAALLRRPA